LSNSGASIFATRFFAGNMNNAPLQLSPGGYSNWQIVMINAGMI
jgi:hypothetical protein